MGIAEEGLDAECMEFMVAANSVPLSKVTACRHGGGNGDKVAIMALAIGAAAFPGGPSASAGLLLGIHRPVSARA